VQNEWTNPAWNPPDGCPPEEITSAIANGQPLDVALVQRNILADKPRVTRFHIAWDDEAAPPVEAMQEEQAQPLGLVQRDPNLQFDPSMAQAGKGGMGIEGGAVPQAMEMD